MKQHTGIFSRKNETTVNDSISIHKSKNTYPFQLLQKYKKYIYLQLKLNIFYQKNTKNTIR